MPTSPEAASVVERLNNPPFVKFHDSEFGRDYRVARESDPRALLAVVEAAKEALEYLKVGEPDAAEVLLRDPLDALYTPDSAEERE